MCVRVEDTLVVLVGVVAEELGPVDLGLHGSELVRQLDVLIREAGFTTRLRGLVALEVIHHRERHGLGPIAARDGQGQKKKRGENTEK
jgi:hypothetical protein